MSNLELFTLGRLLKQNGVSYNRAGRHAEFQLGRYLTLQQRVEVLKGWAS